MNKMHSLIQKQFAPLNTFDSFFTSLVWMLGIVDLVVTRQMIAQVWKPMFACFPGGGERTLKAL